MDFIRRAQVTCGLQSSFRKRRSCVFAANRSDHAYSHSRLRPKRGRGLKISASYFEYDWVQKNCPRKCLDAQFRSALRISWVIYNDEDKNNGCLLRGNSSTYHDLFTISVAILSRPVRSLKKTHTGPAPSFYVYPCTGCRRDIGNNVVFPLTIMNIPLNLQTPDGN